MRNALTSILVLLLISCNKLVKVPEPVNSITTTETFSTTENATAAINAIYSDMSFAGNNTYYANGATTIYTGMTSDELLQFGNINPYQTNTILANDGTINSAFWSAAYFDIYMANAAIEGIAASQTLPSSVKSELTGEAKFIRAYIYFYLVNLFGNLPLVTSTDWASNSKLSRAPIAQIYQQIVSDLIDAENLLLPDYSISGGERIRANSWSAKALLSRVYLYEGLYPQAEQMSTEVIANGGLFNMLNNLDSVFLANSTESILQLQVTNQYPYATQEGNQFIPFDTTSSPNYYLTNQLLSAFEPNDLRRAMWVDSTDYGGTYYYFPYKYKVMVGNQGSITEYYTLLRFSEQYLIRAEAEIQQNKVSDAVNDINTIRQRAGLPPIPVTISQSQALSALNQENRIEFFCEWGHRWLDLKRTGSADSILSSMKPMWTPTDTLYPIPAQEIIADPNLNQNPGY